MSSQVGLTGDIQTLTSKLLDQQQHTKDATGDFTLLISSLQTACKFISSKVRKAGISNLLGVADTGANASGETQKKLDVISNDAFVNCLSTSHKVAVMVSEEEDHPVEVDLDKQGKYVVTFDPLDGSSNIDANVSIGSVFGIWRRVTEKGEKPTAADYLRSGREMVAAGYCIYGSATQFVLCCGGTVDGYTLDTSLGEFLLTHPDIRIPKKGKIYSCNEGYTQYWDQPITEYVESKKNSESPYSLRYVGSMVADVHRTLLYGGIFLYPADKKSTNGKLRVLYESLPMAFIVEKAGGRAITGKGNVLDVKVTNIHQRCGFICGSTEDVNEVEALYQKYSS